MFWIGLTGCMGCGKSTVARLLKEKHGFELISADEVAHSILKSDKDLHQQIQTRLDVSWSSDFDLYRKNIAASVFGSQEKLALLESLMHPKIKIEVQRLKDKLESYNDFLFYDVPLLFEKNMEEQFDFILGVFSSEDIQLQRLKLRNQWDAKEVKSRTAHQLSNDEKMKKCNFVIQNNSSMEKLIMNVDSFVDALREEVMKAEL